MTTIFPSALSSDSVSRQTVHKIKRKPAPTLLDSAEPPLRATKATGTHAVEATIPGTKPSGAYYTIPSSRYPAPDPNDPLAPLSVLRDRDRRCSNNLLSTMPIRTGGLDSKDIKVLAAASTDSLSLPSKSSFIPPKAAQALGVTKHTVEPQGAKAAKENPKSDHPRKRTSVCNFELYPDPPSPMHFDVRINRGGQDDDEDVSIVGIAGKLSTPPRSSLKSLQSRGSTSTKADAGSPVGHYTPHSRQRTQSSFSALSLLPSTPANAPLPPSKPLHVLIPAPEAYPPPSLCRDRSESSASGTSSSGAGSQNYDCSGSVSDSASSALMTPGSSIPPISAISMGSSSGSGSGSRSGGSMDLSDSYALTMSLLTTSGSASASPSRDSSPSRRERGRTNSPGHTPKASRVRDYKNAKDDTKEAERSMSPTGGIIRLARFFTGGKVSRKNSVGSMAPSDGSPKSKQKTSKGPPKSNSSPGISSGKGRTRKISVTSVNISAPISPPVSIPMGQDLRQHSAGVGGGARPFLSLNSKTATRPRAQTTSAASSPSSIHPSVDKSPYFTPFNKTKGPSASASSVGIASASMTEFGVMSDDDVEREIAKDMDLARLKPWTMSIPRKRSSLSLSTLPRYGGNHERESQSQPPTPSAETITSGPGSSLYGCTEAEEAEGSAETYGTRQSKGSKESAVSAASSMGSSYIHVRPGNDLDVKSDGENTSSSGPSMAPRSKSSSGIAKASGGHTLKFPGFRRSHTAAQSSSGLSTGASNGSVRKSKISAPMLQLPVAVNTQLAPTPASMSAISSTASSIHERDRKHERAMSDYGISVLEASTQCELPVEAYPSQKLEDRDSSSTRLPTAEELRQLLSLHVLDEEGKKVVFQELLGTNEEKGKTVVVLFLRHFWCPLDQDYVEEVGDLLRKLSEDNNGWQISTDCGEIQIGEGEGKTQIPEVVLVSNGSAALIKKYNEIFNLGGENGSKLKVRMYTDPSLQMYETLGMGNVGEACVVTSRPTTPTPAALDAPAPFETLPRGRISESKYDAGVPLVRLPRHSPKGHRKARSIAPVSTLFASSTNSLLSARSLSRSRSPSPSRSSLNPLVPLPVRSPSPAPSTTSSTTGATGSYVKHASLMSGIATVVLRAIKVGMPVWEKGGAVRQLGGEAIFKVPKRVTGNRSDSNLQVQCVYAHRMQNAQDHTPFGDVLKLALTSSPSREFVSVNPPQVCDLPVPSSAESKYSLLHALSNPTFERSISAPSRSFEEPFHRISFSVPSTPTKPLHRRAQTDVSGSSLSASSSKRTSSQSNAGMVWWASSPEDTRAAENAALYGHPSKHERAMSDSGIDVSPKEEKLSWGDQLHILRTRTAQSTMRGTSESVKAIRARDSVRSSTGSATGPSSIRARRAVRAPKGPRTRTKSPSMESLASSRSDEMTRSFGSGIEGIESVLEYGDSISTNLALLSTGSPESLWRDRYAGRSTSTLNLSVYYDAAEGDEDPDGGLSHGDEMEEREEDDDIGFQVDVVPVSSRRPSPPASNTGLDSQDLPDNSFGSDYSTASADRTEHLTSMCSQLSEESLGEQAEKLREMLIVRASSSIRSRG